MFFEGSYCTLGIFNGISRQLNLTIFTGFAVDSKLRSAWTGLMYAAINGQLPVMELLISSEANVNFQKGLWISLVNSFYLLNQYLMNTYKKSTLNLFQRKYFVCQTCSLR